MKKQTFKQDLTREQYLNAVVEELRPWFKSAGHELPKKVRVTCGWPSAGGTARKKRSIGQCWPMECSADGTNEIFISPYMDTFVAGEGEQCVGETLVHELCHAVDDCQHAHKAPFVKIMKAVGLEGKPTSTTPGEDVYRELQRIEKSMGKYPHSKLDATKVKSKTQTTRMIKAECLETEYTVRVTRKWLEAYGAPICPCCKKPMTFEVPDDLVQED